MAVQMVPDWQPPARTVTQRPSRLIRAERGTPWRTWADGHWWALRPGDDLPDDKTLRQHYRAAWVWADFHGLRCEGHRDEGSGGLYLRFTPRNGT